MGLHTVHTTPTQHPPRGLMMGAFAAVYLIWGSTYLGIHMAIETLPPFLMAGTRFVLAGSIVYAALRLRGAPRPTPVHWRSALIIGTFLLLGGNGGVTWSSQRVPSGLTALMIATVPLWVVILDWLIFSHARPSRQMALGLALGLGGVALLAGPGDLGGGEQIDPLRAGVLVLASISWAAGSLYSRRAPLPALPQLATGMEMLAGGGLLIVAGTLHGEWADLDLANVSARSAGALAYLSLCGALVAFSAYIWLLNHTTPARAASYAYVNPVVAVILGWALADEPLTARTILAAAIIITSVILITSFRPQGVPRLASSAGEHSAEGTPSLAGTSR